MARHWQEVIPMDRYKVSLTGMLHDYDRKVLTLLYQPLIGPVCVSLYMTLWSELEANRLWSHSSSHYSLMNITGLNLPEIYKARTKLEGIGLMRVYRQEQEGERHFIYELAPPLSPEQFFTDGLLNIYLYKKIGKRDFNRLKKFFCDDKLPEEGFEDITKSFTDIFASDHAESLFLTEEDAESLEPEEDQHFIGRREGEGAKGFEGTFNFELFHAGLSRSLVPNKAFTPEAVETISKLAYLYGIDPLQMQKLVIGAVNVNDDIDLEELRKAAQGWYQIEYSRDLPALTDRVQPLQHRSSLKQPETKEEILIKHLETISPRERLSELSGGAEPPVADLQIIEGVMFNQKLQPGVVNVLIDYVMLRTDMKLTKTYVEKIAGHWSRKKVATVQEAMELAKNEHRQYQEWATSKKDKRTGKKAVRTEIVPDWLKNPEESEPVQDVSAAEQETGTENQELEERKRQLEEKINNLKNRR